MAVDAIRGTRPSGANGGTGNPFFDQLLGAGSRPADPFDFGGGTLTLGEGNMSLHDVLSPVIMSGLGALNRNRGGDGPAFGNNAPANPPAPSSTPTGQPGGQQQPGLGRLGNIFNQIKPVIEGVRDVGGLIAPLFNEKDRPGRQAAETQQQIERAATEIQNRVNNGTLSPDAALRALRGLQASLNILATAGPEGARGAAIANAVLSQVIANISSARNQALSTPLAPGASLTGDPDFQRERLRTILRNRLLDRPVGDAVRGTPTDVLFQASDPFSQLKERMNAVRSTLPSLPPLSEANERVSRRFQGGF